MTYMLFAGWEVRIVKNCDRGLENADDIYVICRLGGPYSEKL